MSSRRVPIRLENLPVELAARAQQHLGSLLREFAFMESTGSSDAPARLRALVALVRERFGPFTDQARAVFERALADGIETVTLEMTVPEEAARYARELDELLDEVDRYCRSGSLLTLAAPPEFVALRRWYLGEFIHQVEGASPTPWPGRDGHDVASTS